MITKETSPNGTFIRFREKGLEVFSRVVLRKEPLSSQQKIEKEAGSLIDLALVGVETFSERSNIQDRWGIYPYQLEIFNYWFAFYILTKSDYELKKLSDSEVFITDGLKPIFVTANKKDQNSHQAHMRAAELLKEDAQAATNKFQEFVGSIIAVGDDLEDQKKAPNITSEVLEIIGSPSALRNAANILSSFYQQWQEGRLSDEEFGKQADGYISKTQIVFY